MGREAGARRGAVDPEEALADQGRADVVAIEIGRDRLPRPHLAQSRGGLERGADAGDADLLDREPRRAPIAYAARAP